MKLRFEFYIRAGGANLFLWRGPQIEDIFLIESYPEGTSDREVKRRLIAMFCERVFPTMLEFREHKQNYILRISLDYVIDHRWQRIYEDVQDAKSKGAIRCAKRRLIARFCEDFFDVDNL